MHESIEAVNTPIVKAAFYQTVNDGWPDSVPEITGQEAVAAAKRLYRKAMGRAWRGKWKLTSGNRFTWPRSGVYFVNPDRRGALLSGWRALVHDISHYCHGRLHPDKRPHDFRHAHLERDLVRYVVESGWLDGKLRRPEKAKPTPVQKWQAERNNLSARIKRWESKEKRAQTALKKLRRRFKFVDSVVNAA